MAKRYQSSELIGEQGGVQTFAGRDVVNGLPVRVYSFVGEPTLKEGELTSDFVPPVLSSSYTGLAGEVVSAFSDEFKRVKGAVAPGQVEALLRETAAALDDAARAGVVHGDLSPERVFFDREGGAGGRFVLEGYGVPWPVHPSEFSAPERIGGASFAGDIFSWARTVKHLSGPLPGELRDLLDRCLNADPSERPHAREVRGALTRYPFGGNVPKQNPQARHDISAFERYAEDDADTEDQIPDDDLGLTLPPKTFKLKEYQRQTTARSSAQPPSQTALQPVAKPAASPVVNPQNRPAVQPPETSSEAVPRPTSPNEVLPVSRTLKTSHSADSLFQRDATEAYKTRLAAYKAKREPVATPSPSAPETTAPSTSSAQEATQTAEPAPPRVRVQRHPDTTDTKRHETNMRVSRDEPDFEDDFEVIDDIKDGPDPTLYRGGRRVLLLTMLGIALLVLLVLQIY